MYLFSGVTIEALGSTSVVLSGGNYHLDNISTGTGPTLSAVPPASVQPFDALRSGNQMLREAFARKNSAYLGFEINPDTDLTITCGATEAMAATMLACSSRVCSRRSPWRSISSKKSSDWRR